MQRPIVTYSRRQKENLGQRWILAAEFLMPLSARLKNKENKLNIRSNFLVLVKAAGLGACDMSRHPHTDILWFTSSYSVTSQVCQGPFVMTISSRWPLLAPLLIVTLCCGPVRGRARPNIIFVFLDDAGWGDFESTDSMSRTSNIERLRKEGLFLNQSYMMPMCAPARSALLTGRWVTGLGAVSEAVLFSSVASLTGSSKGWGGVGGGGMRNDSAEILSQPFFLRGAIVTLWAVLAWVGMSTLWCCPSSISSADHGVALKNGFGEAVVACDMPEACEFPSLDSCQKKVPENPQECRSCSPSSRWSCTPRRRCGHSLNIITKRRRVYE